MTTEYKRQISFGNVIQIGGTLVTVTLAYAAVNATASANHETIAQALTAQASMEGRLRALENTQARADERMANILQLLNRIDGRLERIERKDSP